MNQIRKRLTYANVMSSIAVFLLLGGASAFAAKSLLPKNSVGTKQLKKEAVTLAKIKKGTRNALKGQVGPQGPEGKQGEKGEKGEKGDTGATGLRGPSDAYYAFNNVTGTNSKSISLVLPAGSYVLTGSMYAITNDTTNFGEISCALTATNNTTPNEGLSVLTLGPAPTGATDYRTTEANTALTIGAGGGTVTYSCSRFAGTASISLYQARIIATQVEALH